MALDQVIVLAGAPPAGSPGCSFGAMVTTPSIGVGGIFVLPNGSFFLVLQTNMAIEVQTAVGVWTVIHTTMSGLMISDGTNVRIHNNTGAPATAQYIPIR